MVYVLIQYLRNSAQVMAYIKVWESPVEEADTFGGLWEGVEGELCDPHVEHLADVCQWRDVHGDVRGCSGKFVVVYPINNSLWIN